DLKAVHLRQHDVKQDDVRVALAREPQAFCSVVGADRRHVVLLQIVSQDIDDGTLVIDDKHLSVHFLSSRYLRALSTAMMVLASSISPDMTSFSSSESLYFSTFKNSSGSRCILPRCRPRAR